MPCSRIFARSIPRCRSRYYDLNSTEVYNRYLSETAANAETADVLWSGSMDLQLKLVADGHALTYRSPGIGARCRNGRCYEDRAWGTTFEPLVIAYNKRLLPADASAELARRSPAPAQGASRSSSPAASSPPTIRRRAASPSCS